MSLLEFFDGRFLEPDHSWADVHGRLRPFLEQVAGRHRVFDLQIDTHTSLAFATGAELHAKLGLDISILQFSRSGPQSWSATLGASVPSADLAVDDVRVDRGSDVALVLAITHDIVCEVREHIDEADLPVGRVVSIRPAAGSGQSAVHGGEHALAMADEIARVVKARTRKERASTLHLFASAPNGLVFFLGQLSPSFGHVKLYEYDFEQIRSRGYELSFSLPTPPDR